MELTEVKGIGPATGIKLKAAGINNAEDLAKASIEEIMNAGVGKATAEKILKNAVGIMEVLAAHPEVKPKPVTIVPPKKKKKVVPKEIKAVRIPVAHVKGVGPKTRDLLEDNGIFTAQELAEKDAADLQQFGLTKTTATKIIKSAQDQVSDLTDPTTTKKAVKKVEPKKEEKPIEVKPKKKAKVEETVVEEKPAKKEKKKPKATKKPAEEIIKSPMPQGIPTKKKRGAQISKATVDDSEPIDTVEKAEGWHVEARELSEDELEKRKLRQEEMARSKRITRPIPDPIAPIKAERKGKKKPGVKPVKQERVHKKVKIKKGKTKVQIEYFSHDDLFPAITDVKMRGISGKSGESMPRIELDRGTYLGKIASHRRSRRVIHEKQVIVKLVEGFSPDQLVGKKVYFQYPDTDTKVAGSISKRFGKASSSKVLINFKKGIRMEGMNSKIFIK